MSRVTLFRLGSLESLSCLTDRIANRVIISHVLLKKMQIDDFDCRQ